MLQSKCLRIATSAPWYISNKPVCDDLGVPYFADRTRSLTERFDSMLADVGNRLVTQIGRNLHRPSVDSSPLKKKDSDLQLVLATRKCDHVDTLNRAQLILFDYSD